VTELEKARLVEAALSTLTCVQCGREFPELYTDHTFTCSEMCSVNMLNSGQAGQLMRAAHRKNPRYMVRYTDAGSDTSANIRWLESDEA
jgi:hypothetical protein